MSIEAKATSAAPLSVMPFLGLARDLAALFVPVAPHPQFHTDLYQSLVIAARQQQAHERLFLSVTPPGSTLPAPGRRWAIGAAAVGSAVSVAGLMAYLWWQRGRRAA